MNKDDICTIPVTATYRIIDGEPVMVAAEYAEISAADIAKFLVERCGIDAIYGEGAGD